MRGDEGEGVSRNRESEGDREVEAKRERLLHLFFYWVESKISHQESSLF